MRGVLAGALALVTLHTLVAYKGPSKRLADLAGGDGLAVRAVRRFLDPTVPAIPDRRGFLDDVVEDAADQLARRSYPTPTPR